MKKKERVMRAESVLKLHASELSAPMSTAEARASTIGPQALIRLRVLLLRSTLARRPGIVSGRRLIPADYLPAIEEALREAGHLQAKESAVPT
jgi:hypothetical protein